jgi:hypothetical protein
MQNEDNLFLVIALKKIGKFLKVITVAHQAQSYDITMVPLFFYYFFFNMRER